MKNLSIDVESFSDVDLSKCGVYKYASSPAFQILLFGYSVDHEDGVVIALGGDSELDTIYEALQFITKVLDDQRRGR